MKIIITIGLILTLFSIANCTQEQDVECNISNFETIENYNDLMLNLNIAYNDLGELNKCSRKSKKPILTIYGCYTCIGNPYGLWRPLANKEVNPILQKGFLIRYYYIDDKSLLPDSIAQWTNFNTIGEYFANKQAQKYKVYSQPFYTITNWKEQDLTDPISYVGKDEQEMFNNFIFSGIKNRH